MKVLIVEDEQLAVEKLSKTIMEIDSSTQIVGVTESIVATVDWLNHNEQPDLILMDIELADGQSFEIFNRADVISPVIFITSYDEYAIRAFKVNSVDYLLKPVKNEDLMESLSKLRSLKKIYADKLLPVQDFKNLILELQAQSKPKEFRERFLVKHGQRLVSIETSEIAFFYTEEKVSFFKTKNNVNYIVEYTLDELENQVNQQLFFRISRQFLIASYSIDSMQSYFNNRVILKLKPPTEKQVIVSRDKVQAFKYWMGK